MTRAGTHTHLRAGAAFALGALVAAMAAGKAPATTPGKNGRMVFTQQVGTWTQLFTIEPDGTGLKQVTHFDDSDSSNGNWSPGGKRIVFERNFPTNHVGIYTINANGGDLRSLTPVRKGFYEGAPAYSPDGKKVIFARGRCATLDCDGPRDRSGLFTRNVDGTRVRAITPPQPIGPISKRSFDHPQFSPDGKRVAYIERVGEHNAAVFVVKLHGGKPKRLTSFRMGVDDRVDWSPDGSLILFGDNYRGVDVYTIRPNGSGLKRIYRTTRWNYSPDSWSPDGRRIMIKRGAYGNADIDVMNADGTGLRPVTHGLNVGGGSWGTHP